METDRRILILNGGSSSLKFAVCDGACRGTWTLRGQFDRLSTPRASFVVRQNEESRSDIGALDHAAATGFLLNWLDERLGLPSVAAVGHRIVHGGSQYQTPRLIDAAMIADLRRLSRFAPRHLPTEIDVISVCRERMDAVPQVACFDTAFHCDMPAVARMLPIPRRFKAEGVVRYGFHGISYAHVLDVLRHEAGHRVAKGRLIFAHLGNGASLAAVRDGKSIDTTMGFTPAAGIPMSTRSGDLDPGVLLYLARNASVDVQGFERIVNQESGLLGISETSGDLRDLLEREEADERAAEAVALFCYSIRKQIGAYAAALGGLDMLVFTGGIGENAPEIRSRICEGLGFLGIELDPAHNTSAAPVISMAGARVEVRVIAADEESVIAGAVSETLSKQESVR